MDRRYGAAAVILIALIGFFTSAFYFQTFGKEIDPISRPAGTIVPLLFLVTGLFGIGYARGVRSGLGLAGAFIVVALIAFAIGIISGNYAHLGICLTC